MPLPRFPHVFTEGDTGPSINGAYLDDNGDPYDFTGQSVGVEVGAPTSLSFSATVTVPSSGEFSIDWPSGLVAGEGQEVLVRKTDASGDDSTLARFLIDVLPEP